MTTGGMMATGGTSGAAGVPSMAGTTGGATTGGTGGTGGEIIEGNLPDEGKKDDGCGCRVPGASQDGSNARGAWLALLAACVLAHRRRSRDGKTR